MTRSETIVAKYLDALRQTNVRLGGLDEAAVRLALHLAVKEAMDGRLQPPEYTAWQREAENAYKQIGHLNEWLERNQPGLYHSPSHNTADAVLAALSNIQHDLDTSYARTSTTTALHKGEIANLRNQLATTQAELASALADVKALGEELKAAEKNAAYEKLQVTALEHWLVQNAPELTIPEHFITSSAITLANHIIDILNRQRVTIEDLCCDLAEAREKKNEAQP